ncbi:MAG TPA: hypothetical protein VIV14_08355 [Gammaproteobacteria bacterium]
MQTTPRKFVYPVITAAVATLLLPLPGGEALAQFGSMYQLPQNDFTWTWGGRRNPRDFEDISVAGSERGFRCNLEAKLSINSRLSRLDVRSIENDIRGAINFVQTVSYTMNDLDARREIEWAVLECEKPQRREREEEEQEEDN